MTKVYKFSRFYSWKNSTIHKNTIPIPTKKETMTNIEQTHSLRLLKNKIKLNYRTMIVLLKIIKTDTNTNFM